MTDIEVIEIGVGDTVELAYDPADDLVGAEVISISGEVPTNLGQSYTHTQSAPANPWLIFHTLPFTPAGVRIADQDGNRLYPQRESYPAQNRVRLDFTRPVAGTAYLS